MAKKIDLPELVFQTYGSGPEVLLAFHGYGQDHSVYEGLSAALNNRYSVYSFDLYLHGEHYRESSSRLSDDALTVEHWQRVITNFLELRGITEFSLVGYSLGARFALTLVESMAPRIKQVILIAPDGIKSSRWYQVASGTWLGNRLLRYTVVRPRPFFWVLRKAYQLKVVEKSVVKFVESHMNTRADRYWVYQRWVTFRRIQPSLRRVKRECNAHQVRVVIFLGKYDSVVKRKRISAFHKSLKYSRLHYLPSGHATLISKVADYYANGH